MVCVCFLGRQGPPKPQSRPRTTGASRPRTFTRNFAPFPHHVSDRAVFPGDRIAMALFSAARSTSPPIPEADRRTSRGGGRAARGVSSWSWFRCLRFSVAAWCKEASDGGTFAIFRVSVASRLPARTSIVGLICAVGSVSLPASDRRNATSSVISRLVPGGCWVVIAACTSALDPFLISPFGTEFYTR